MLLAAVVVFAGAVPISAREERFDGGRSRSSTPAAAALMPAANVSFRPGPLPASGRLRPFVVAGLAWLADDEMALPMLQFGGGVDWWLLPRAGLHLEVREQFPSMLVIRGGVVLR